MIRTLLFIGILSGLVSCSGEQAIPADSKTCAEAYKPFPSAISLTTAYHVRRDHIYTTKAGDARRGSSLELLEGDALAVVDSLGESLVAQGFHAMNLKDKGDGVTRVAYRKTGYGRINLSATPSVGEKPSNPDAVGVVAIDWPVPQSRKETAGAAIEP